MKRLRWLGAAVVAGSLAAVPAAAPAPAAVQVGSSGWQWGNPLPQGNTLRAIDFNGPGAGYAVGDFGTLLKTANGGVDWTGLPAGTFTNLTEVQAVDADTVVAGGGCVARRSDDAGQTFARIAFTNVESSCREPLAGMWFVSDKLGFLVLADGSVFQTVDGGTEFATKTGIPGTRVAGGRAIPTDLRFLSDTVGFATTSEGKIFQTIDAGTSWKPVSDTGRAVRAITFASASVGYAVGEDSLFLRTADGGATWVAKDAGGAGAQALRSVDCASERLCVATTGAGTVLALTANGGDTFTYPSPSTDPVFGAAWADATQLVAAGRLGSTVISADAGATFAPRGSRLMGRFTRIRTGTVAGTAYAPGPDGTLGKTTDGGQTWQWGNVATSEGVADVSFPTADVGYALDAAGGLFRTSTGGATWRTLDTGTTARPTALLAPSTSSVLLVGPTGVRRSTDEGGTFTGIRGAVGRLRLGEVDRAGSAIIAYGTQDVIRSLDGGKTWSTVLKPGRYVGRGTRRVNRLGVAHVDFVTARQGFLLDAAGRVWRTVDGGRRWVERPGIGTQRAYGMAFSSAKNGFLVVDRFGDVGDRSGFLLRTDDGGETWHPQFVVSTPIPGRGIAATPGRDYLLGGESSLLFSTTDGDAGAPSTLTLATGRTRYRKPTRIRVSGRLSPATGVERVTVAYRRAGTTRWSTATTKVAANGSFTTSWNLAKGRNTFVAQWAGDFKSRGDGSKVLTVTVGK